MPEFLNSIFSDETQITISVSNFLLCLFTALTEGALYYFACSFKSKGSKSLRTALALLPSVVCAVIIMVNGNVGTGVAVAGAFSLVRFRSAQGTAKEICIIFMAMCSGLMAGVGYLFYAMLFTVIMCVFICISNLITVRMSEKNRDRILKITVPENLEFPNIFDDIFDACTDSRSLKKIKTANMGSLYRLTYNVKIKNGVSEKDFIDRLRIKNGNLEILLLSGEEEPDAL